jgi:hypothetical protein
MGIWNAVSPLGQDLTKENKAQLDISKGLHGELALSNAPDDFEKSNIRLQQEFQKRMGEIFAAQRAAAGGTGQHFVEAEMVADKQGEMAEQLRDSEMAKLRQEMGAKGRESQLAHDKERAQQAISGPIDFFATKIKLALEGLSTGVLSFREFDTHIASLKEQKSREADLASAQEDKRRVMERNAADVKRKSDLQGELAVSRLNLFGKPLEAARMELTNQYKAQMQEGGLSWREGTGKMLTDLFAARMVAAEGQPREFQSWNSAYMAVGGPDAQTSLQRQMNDKLDEAVRQLRGINTALSN